MIQTPATNIDEMPTPARAIAIALAQHDELILRQIIAETAAVARLILHPRTAAVRENGNRNG